MSNRVRDIVQELAKEDTKGHLVPLKSRTSAAAQGLGQLHREIAEEVAGSLGRAARRVEALLRELSELERRHERAVQRADASAARRYRRAFNEVRDRATAKLRDLRIQREALGFRRHDELAKHYPIPPRKPEP